MLQTKRTSGGIVYRSRASGFAAVVVAVVMLAAVPALAAGNGAVTDTVHTRGAQSDGVVVLDFVPANLPAPLPAGCWANSGLAIVSTYGNAVQHSIGNNNGFWFTTTFTGDAAVFPVPQPPAFDDNGNVIVDRSGGPLGVGHLTSWFGGEFNAKNTVVHGTVTFHGTSTSNPAQVLNLGAHFQSATNASGNPTAQVGVITC